MAPGGLVPDPLIFCFMWLNAVNCFEHSETVSGPSCVCAASASATSGQRNAEAVTDCDSPFTVNSDASTSFPHEAPFLLRAAKGIQIHSAEKTCDAHVEFREKLRVLNHDTFARGLLPHRVRIFTTTTFSAVDQL